MGKKKNKKKNSSTPAAPPNKSDPPIQEPEPAAPVATVEAPVNAVLPADPLKDEPKTESEVEPMAAVEAELEPAVGAEPAAELESAAEPKSTAEPVAEAEPESIAEAAPVAAAEEAAEAEAAAVPEAVIEAEPAAEAEAVPAAETAAVAEPEPEPQPFEDPSLPKLSRFAAARAKAQAAAALAAESPQEHVGVITAPPSGDTTASKAAAVKEAQKEAADAAAKYIFAQKDAARAKVASQSPVASPNADAASRIVAQKEPASCSVQSDSDFALPALEIVENDAQSEVNEAQTELERAEQALQQQQSKQQLALLILTKRKAAEEADAKAKAALDAIVHADSKQVAPNWFDDWIRDYRAIDTRDQATERRLLDLIESAPPEQIELTEALSWALDAQFETGSRTLLRARANPNRAAREFPSLGFTPLHIAANGGSTGLLQQLISQKADVNARDLHGHSALHLTGLTKTSAPIFKAMALLDGRANMNATDSLGCTPLHWVCRQQQVNLQMVELLLENNADVQATELKGRTPIDFMELQLDDESSPIGLDCSAEDITPSSRDRSQSQIRGMVRGMLYQYRPSTPRANAARERSPSTFKPSPTENQPIRCQGICTVS